MAIAKTVDTIRHPYYTTSADDWYKWRLTYEGGSEFIDKYLKKFSVRESDTQFATRKSITYNPAFARAALDEIKNSIFQRLVDIRREGGSETYNNAIKGADSGIDLLGSSMNAFIGRKLLPELLSMSRVGVYVDMPEISGITIADAKDKRPYLYFYKTEDICSWTYDEDENNNEFSSILLRDYFFEYDDETGLPVGYSDRYRRIWKAEGKVLVQYYDTNGKIDEQITVLDIPRIPFVLLEISNSLLQDVADYQIALLNLASSDISYSLQSNFPFYVEQFDPRADVQFIRKVGQDTPGTASDAGTGKVQEVKVGAGQGRRYPVGMERPGYIHPSSEPLEASMKKQEQLKQEIRQLVNLSVTNLVPQKMASAESKGYDQQSLESGLSYIGLELEHMERKVASFWDMYEKKGAATVNYPENYSLKSEADKIIETKALIEVLDIVPSKTYQKAVCREIANLVVGRKVTTEELEKIMKEVNSSKGMTADLEIIAKHVEIGIVDLETASEISGYPKGTVEKAAEDHAKRLARIAESQAAKNEMVNGGARGVSDADDNPTASGSKEKAASRDTTQDDKVTDKTRGKADGSRATSE